MKKILFCNIPMKKDAEKSVYTSEDLSIPVTSRAVLCPVNAYLSEILNQNDELKAVIIAKKDKFGNYEVNLKTCIDELTVFTNEKNAKLEVKVIYTDFDEAQDVHDKLLLDIVDELEDNANVLIDITYGPKDLPIVEFTALNIAEKFFNCTIDNIIYGQANFKDGKVVDTKICDMTSLYYLNSITNTVNCKSSEEAKKMLKILLSK